MRKMDGNSERDQDDERPNPQFTLGWALAIGTGVGVAVFAATGEAVWVAIGPALGVVVGAAIGYRER